MSRKFDRRRQIEKSALEILKASLKPKPRWMSKFMWVWLVGFFFLNR